MVNNVGTYKNTLNTNLGTVITLTSDLYEDITILTGELGKGFLIFDSAGTLGVVTNFSEDHLEITTYAISIDVEKILGLSY